MNTPVRSFKFSGLIGPHDALHQTTATAQGGAAPDEHYLAPTTVPVTIISPAPKRVIGVPQYSPTVVGTAAAGYNPGGDCNGNFMSAKFQPNNNCYAYGCNIASNTFPQPGRASGFLLTATDMTGTVASVGATVSGYAVKDGLQFVGTTKADLMAFKSVHQGTTPPGLLGAGNLAGHFVALMISPAGDANWPGDYHWARCDNSWGPCDSWSQKDGNDQVTNFDFAGKPITDPGSANWTVNQGPVAPGNPSAGSDQLVTYAFYGYLFVPSSGVNII